MPEPTDNVTRLTTIAKMMEDGNWYSSAKVVLAAADEIERLRVELDRLGPLMLRANSEIQQVRAERDEARREVCENNPFGLSHRQLARIKGWDCFDLENTNGR